MEPRLLTSQSVQRLFECTTLSGVFRTLTDMGFGTSSVAQGDFDALFDSEQQKLNSFLEEFNVDGALDSFLILKTSLDLKRILKAKYTSKPYPKLGGGGYMDEEALVRLAESDEPTEEEGADPILAAAVKAIKKLADGGKLTPRTIDCEIDRAAYSCIFAHLKSRDALIKEYFRCKVDFANICSYLRCRRLSLDEEFFKQGYIEGGKLDMYNIFGEDEKLRALIKGTIYESATLKALDGGEIHSFEAMADNALYKLVKEQREDMFSVAPILSYYLSRATEIKVAKLIVAGVKNGVSEDKIRERMRDLNA